MTSGEEFWWALKGNAMQILLSTAHRQGFYGLKYPHVAEIWLVSSGELILDAHAPSTQLLDCWGIIWHLRD